MQDKTSILAGKSYPLTNSDNPTGQHNVRNLVDIRYHAFLLNARDKTTNERLFK